MKTQLLFGQQHVIYIRNIAPENKTAVLDACKKQLGSGHKTKFSTANPQDVFVGYDRTSVIVNIQGKQESLLDAVAQTEIIKILSRQGKVEYPLFEPKFEPKVYKIHSMNNLQTSEQYPGKVILATETASGRIIMNTYDKQTGKFWSNIMDC